MNYEKSVGRLSFLCNLNIRALIMLAVALQIVSVVTTRMCKSASAMGSAKKQVGLPKT